MGGCQSKQSTNVANSTSKPEHAPSATKTTRESESAERRASHSSSHKEGGWFRSHVSGIHPEAVYVFKTTFFHPDGKQEKVFVNVFYHKKVESEHCLVQDKAVIVDKKGENCFAYGVVIASDLREKCLEEKYREWVSERVIELLNQLFPDARLDVKGVKLPIVKKGFMGDSIPYFSLDTNLVSWKSLSYTKSTDEPSTSTSNAGNAAQATTPNPVASNTATNTTESAATTSASSSSLAAGAKETSHSSSAAPANTTAATSSTTTVASRAGTPPPVSQEAQSSNKPDKDAATEIAEIPVPRRLTGWMKKQGHVAKNWKTRFFVLDHGFLTYYVDQQEKPPFGVDKKGQVCLAGYRDKNAMKNAAGNAAILTAGYENKATPQRPRDEDDDNEYDENDENSCLIQLEFFPQIVDAHALDELKRRNGDATFKHDVHKEFLLICRTQQERDGWLAALEAHTTYIEMIALKFIQQESASAGSATAGSNNTATTATNSNKDTRSMSTTGDVKRPSLFTSNSLNHSSISRASRRASMALSAQKWSVFLNKNEKVVLMGIVEKPNPVGYRYLRELLLVQRQDGDETAPGESSKTGGCPKRLIYIDSNSYEKKGEMLWLDGANAKYPKVKVAGDRVEVTDVNGKQLIFYPKDDLTPEVWAQEINGIPPV